MPFDIELMSSDGFAHDSDTMEKPQEMQQIETPKKVGTCSKSAESMALIRQETSNSRSKEVRHIYSESEGESDLFDGKSMVFLHLVAGHWLIDVAQRTPHPHSRPFKSTTKRHSRNWRKLRHPK